MNHFKLLIKEKYPHIVGAVKIKKSFFGINYWKTVYKENFDRRGLNSRPYDNVRDILIDYYNVRLKTESSVLE